MKTTDIYGLLYIEADDLVSAAPAQFKTMAEGIETALVEVDSRRHDDGEQRPVFLERLRVAPLRDRRHAGRFAEPTDTGL